MKRILLSMFLMFGLSAVLFALDARPCVAMGCPSYFDVDPGNADQLLADKLEAQALKKRAVAVLKAGDEAEASRLWTEAAAKHPESLVKASYLWNAACCLVSYKDQNNDWRIDPKRASQVANNSRALTLLDEAKAQAEAESPYCSGINRQDLLRLISLVRTWVERYAVTD
jgi:hypothetical protein